MSETRDERAIDQIRPEHHRLGLIFAETHSRLVEEEGGVACADLREALAAHFEQEESLYYPTIWKLHPQHEERLRRLIVTHADFLAQLDRVIGLIERGEFETARADFSELQSQFRGHEAAEESLLRSID